MSRNSVKEQNRDPQNASRRERVPWTARPVRGSQRFINQVLTEKEEYRTDSGHGGRNRSSTYSPNKKDPRSPRFYRPPGYLVAKILAVLCRKRTVEGLIKPLHGELLQEHFESLQRQEYWNVLVQRMKIPCALIYAVTGERLLNLLGSIFRGISSK